MNLTLIRHSIPDYSDILETDSTKKPTKAHLSKEGIALAHNNFKDIDFSKNEIVLVSPFIRALDTANILKGYVGDIPFIVEENLHEWLPDKNFVKEVKDIKPLYKDYILHNGESIEDVFWETDLETKKRVFDTLFKYKNYNNIIIVAHSRLFKVCFNLSKCDFASINYKEFYF